MQGKKFDTSQEVRGKVVVMPYRYVREVLLRELQKRDIKSISEATEVGESSLVGLIEGKEIARHNTLIKIVHGLLGRVKRDEFIVQNKDFSITFRAAALFTLPDNRQDNVENLPSPSDLINPRIYEVLIYTGCEYGFNKEKLLKILPYRSELIESLLSRGILVENKDGRVFSSIDNPDDPYIYLVMIKNKIEIKMSQTSYQSFGPYNISARENSLTPEGVGLMLQAISLFNEAQNRIIENHSVKDGTILSTNVCGFTFHMRESDKEKINLAIEKFSKIRSLENLV